MSVQKLVPGCFPLSLWCRLHAMSLQNVRDRGACDGMAQIGKCALNAEVTPTAILLGHLNNELCDLSRSHRPARCSKRATVILARNQSSMPGQQRFGRDDCGDLGQDLPTEHFGSHGETSTLIIRESKALMADLLSKYAIFL